MKKNLANNSYPKGEYWDVIITTLSSYTANKISDEGKVLSRLIEDDYFLVNDVWELNYIGRISNFEEQFNNYKGSAKKLKFSSKNHNICLELKFVFHHILFSEGLKFSSLFTHHSPSLKKLIKFLNEKHPQLHSILDLNVDNTEKEWIWWLNNNGVKTIRSVKPKLNREYQAKTKIANFFRLMHGKLSSQTDLREEWEKDKWDIRVLNERYGVDYKNKTSESYYIYFGNIENPVFKEYFKQYIKTRLLSGRKFTVSTAMNYSVKITKFLNFISVLEPDWNDLNDLTRKHIEKYLEYIRNYAKNILSHKYANPKHNISKNISIVNTFLSDIQQLDYKIAPKTPTVKLILPHDYPSREKKSVDDIKYIPDFVLEQLFMNINYLHPDVQPIVWVAFKSGLRISDVLSLTQNCLICLNGKYSIQTDITKTYVEGHKIPIDEHLANMLAVLIHKSKELSNEDNNPNKYIFVRYGGFRKGRPYSQAWVRHKLYEFAEKRNITDENGIVFHFNTHKFRHTYAVKLINGGADILTVQELLAHASPEMTMRYARLVDDTKRKEFEKVVKRGVFTFDLNGEIHQVEETEDIPEDILDMMWKDEKLNALDNPYGTCRARVNGNCPLSAEPPCLTANDGKPCFDLAVGMDSFDVKKYELLIESVTKNIQVAKEYGRVEMVAANEKNLERYQDIYETIKNGNVIFGRLDRMKRQLDRKKSKGVLHG